MALQTKTRDALIDPIFNNNPIMLQVLGICSALAVTTPSLRLWFFEILSKASF